MHDRKLFTSPISVGARHWHAWSVSRGQTVEATTTGTLAPALLLIRVEALDPEPRWAIECKLPRDSATTKREIACIADLYASKHANVCRVTRSPKLRTGVLWSHQTLLESAENAASSWAAQQVTT